MDVKIWGIMVRVLPMLGGMNYGTPGSAHAGWQWTGWPNPTITQAHRYLLTVTPQVKCTPIVNMVTSSFLYWTG
jgi:hypothetical protein